MMRQNWFGFYVITIKNHIVLCPRIYLFFNTRKRMDIKGPVLLEVDVRVWWLVGDFGKKNTETQRQIVKQIQNEKGRETIFTCVSS